MGERTSSLRRTSVKARRKLRKFLSFVSSFKQSGWKVMVLNCALRTYGQMDRRAGNITITTSVHGVNNTCPTQPLNSHVLSRVNGGAHFQLHLPEFISSRRHQWSSKLPELFFWRTSFENLQEVYFPIKSANFCNFTIIHSHEKDMVAPSSLINI